MFHVRVLGVLAVAWLVGCPAPDVCADVECGSGRCVVDRGVAACWCDEGFLADGLRCVPAAVDPCASNPCAGESASVCLVDAGAASCVCPADRVEVDGGCVLRSACVPSPCGAVAHQSVCELVDGGARCVCEPGYAPSDAGCADTPAWTCDGPVQGAPGSSGEPDDCPPQATPLFPDGTSAARELRPAGEEDWFLLSVQPGHVYELATQVSSGGTGLLVEVFDASGLRLLAADTRGGPEAQARFAGPAVSPVVARVRALSPSATCTYEVQFLELGVDDWPDVASAASALMPGARFEGDVQFPGDLDLVKLLVPANTAVRLAMPTPDGGDAPDVVVDVWSADGGASRRLQWEETVAAFSRDEAVVLVAQGRTSQAMGRFALVSEGLGADDVSDERAFAPLVTPTGAPVSAVFERGDDLDSIAFEQDAGSYYQVSCDGAADAGCVATVRFGTRVVASGSALQWKNSAAGRLTATFSSVEAGAPRDYSFTLEDFGPDDHTFLPGTLVTPGTPVSGRLEETADVDAFHFTAQARHLYRIFVTPASVDLELYGPMSGLPVTSGASLQHFAQSAGEYRVLVRPAQGTQVQMLTYLLEVVDEGPDDHGDTAATATPLVLGQPATGATQYPGDVDWFSFAAVENHLYRVQCTATGSPPCRFTVRDPSGMSVYLGASWASTAIVRAPQTGTMTVVLPADLGAWLDPYSLTVTELGIEDHGDTDATATPYQTLGAPLTGVLTYAGDRDVFRFDALAGETYSVAIERCVVEAHTASGVGLLSSNSTSTRAGLLAPVTGPVFVTVSYCWPVGATYTLVIEDTGPDDHGDSEALATAGALGTPMTGVAQYGTDVDLLSFGVTPGHIYRADCTSSFACSLFARSGGLWLASASGTPDAGLAVRASTTQLFIGVQSTTGISAWTVSVADVGADDHGDTLPTGTPLGLGAPPTAGVLQAVNDIDVFTVGPVQAGDIVRFTFVGGSDAGRTLKLVNTAGQANEYSLQGATTTELGVRAASAGVVQAQVLTRTATGDDPYTIAAQVVTDDAGDSPSTAAPLVLGVPVAGRQDYPLDEDYFSVNLTPGLWLLNIQGGAWARVYAPDGTEVGGSSASTIFSAPVAGRYVVSVPPLFSTQGSYTLLVQ